MSETIFRPLGQAGLRAERTRGVAWPPTADGERHEAQAPIAEVARIDTVRVERFPAVAPARRRP